MGGQKGFRYVYSPVHIKKVFQKIQDTNRPTKLTFPYMRDNWLLKNKQCSAVLDILKDMEFISNSGIPLEPYGMYQNRNIAKVTLSEGIKKAYASLFAVYSKAQELPKDIIEGFFAQQTGKTGSVLNKMVTTFKTLCSLADFSEVKEIIKEAEEQNIEERLSKEIGISKIQLEPNIQVNIGINIAADTPDDKIKVIFENMKKYLLTRDKE